MGRTKGSKNKPKVVNEVKVETPVVKTEEVTEVKEEIKE